MSQKEVDDLGDQEWAEHFADLQYIREEEMKHQARINAQMTASMLGGSS
ncbi:hypothetical protein [Rufibacter quisquiliarum]|uniref:Uncharacterized protein n=1 Tax=Rufibacter quisquiliarum TaxID=1549639 RepID=A0A839GJW6_9BACT|nr:hypothetical protein [Rufibacter quisquiliarum]MBA9078940.1 hypothetical protein [Rufibacter quisquiliarum]